MKRLLLISVIASILFQGCTILSIGSNSGQCEGNCDYSKAGICDDVITIYKNRNSLKNRYVKHNPIWFDEDPYPKED